MLNYFKVLLAVLTVALANLQVFAETLAEKPSLGDGKEISPYQIRTLAHLRWVSETDSVRMKHFIQTADIDASETKSWYNGDGFFPIGDGGKGSNGSVYPSGRAGEFSGTYNGQGYVISNLYINYPDGGYLGLFGGLSDPTAKIEHLGVENIEVAGYSFVGGIAGQNRGTISNCYVTGKVSGSDSYSATGGLAGQNYNIVERCYSACVRPGTYGGGLIGANGGTVQSSYYDREISGRTDNGKGSPKTTAEMKQISTFAGWDFDNVWHIEEGIGYPNFNQLSVPATITLDLQYDGLTLNITGTTGTLLQNPGMPAARNGYTFGGWFKETNCINVWDFENDLIRKKTMTIYAKWSPIEYSITYNLGGGDAVAGNPTTFTAQSGELTINPSTRKGYKFGGWFANADFSGAAITSIPSGTAGNKELWAKWTIEPYTIAYELNGGTNNSENPQFYNVESGDIVLKNPTLQNKYFAGWKDNQALLFQSVISIPAGTTGNKTFYAKWSDTPYEMGEYSISYHLNGGENNASNPIKYNTETDFPNLAIPLLSPARKGAEFAGWFDNGDLTGNVVSVVPANTAGNKEYWAKWTLIPYTIMYDLNGGLEPSDKKNPLGYNVESDDIIFNHPVKENWFFAGWYKTADFADGSFIARINKGSTGNLELFAKWSDTPVELPAPVREIQKARKYGILLESAVVSQSANIRVITPERVQTNITVCDNLGNVMFETSGRTDTFVWNLTNKFGRRVANGSYLIIAEAKGVSGKVYRYSAKVGVKR